MANVKAPRAHNDPSESRESNVANGRGPTVPDHTLIRLIGRGSYGTVWLAQNVMGTYRAVKVVDRYTFEDDHPYNREYTGIRNFEPLSRSNENQVQILHIGRNEHNNYFYYVMELADDAIPAQCGESSGPSVGCPIQAPELGVGPSDESEGKPKRQQVNRPTIQNPSTYVPRTLQWELKGGKRLPVIECLRISLGLTNALKHLHDHGLVHRDVKPGNIIFVNGIPKLADIGLVTDSNGTMSYTGGSQGYVAPEGAGRPKADLYSLGKVIYEMCTGKDRLEFPALPGDIGTWRERPQVLELLAISLKACEPNSADRYATAEQLLADLVMVQAGRSVRRLRMLERGRKRVLAVAVGVFLIGACAWGIQRYQTRSVQREVLVRDAQMARTADRWSGSWSQGRALPGWSDRALDLLRKAGKIKVDDNLRGHVVATLAGLDAQVRRRITDGAYHLAFDAQGHQLLMDSSERKRVRLWDYRSDAVTYFNSTNNGPLWFASDGSPRQFVSDKEGSFFVLDLKRAEKLREFQFRDFKREFETEACVVSPDASLAAAAVVITGVITEGRIAVWETATGRLLDQSDAVCASLAISPDNKFLATGDSEGRIRVRALPSLSDIRFTLQQGRSQINALAFQRDVTRALDTAPRDNWLLAAGDAGGNILVYRVEEQKREVPVKAICLGSGNGVYAVAFSPDGTTIASAGYDNAMVYDTVHGRRLLSMNAGGYQRSVAFSPDGAFLAVGREPRFSAEPDVKLFQFQPSRGIQVLRGSASQCMQPCFSPDGRRLAALAQNWDVLVWNLASNHLDHIFQAPQGIFADNAALAFSRDSRQLAFATSRHARLWNLQDGQVVQQWKLPGGLGQGICFEPSGRLIHFQWDREATSGTCHVRELKLDGGQIELWSSVPFTDRILDISMASDARFLAVSGRTTNNYKFNHVLKFVDPLSGRELPSPPAYSWGEESTLVADPAGHLLAIYGPKPQQTLVLQIPSLQVVASNDGRILGLSPGARWFVVQSRDYEGGFRLKNADDPNWSLALGLDHTFGNFPQFDSDGKSLAFASRDGPVLVFSPDQLIRFLHEVGLGW